MIKSSQKDAPNSPLGVGGRFYSTNNTSLTVSLQEAVVKGLAEDKGLFMPEKIEKLPQEFFDTIGTLSFPEIAYTVAEAFFGSDIEADELKKIVNETLSFDTPLVEVEKNIYSLELFHGHTLAFKDVAHAGLFHQQTAKHRTCKCAGSHFGRYRKCRGQRISGCGRHPRVCALSQRAGEQNSGKSVYHARTEYHRPGSGRNLRRLPAAGEIGLSGRGT